MTEESELESDNTGSQDLSSAVSTRGGWGEGQRNWSRTLKPTAEEGQAHGRMKSLNGHSWEPAGKAILYTCYQTSKQAQVLCFNTSRWQWCSWNWARVPQGSASHAWRWLQVMRGFCEGMGSDPASMEWGPGTGLQLLPVRCGHRGDSGGVPGSFLLGLSQPDPQGWNATFNSQFNSRQGWSTLSERPLRCPHRDWNIWQCFLKLESIKKSCVGWRRSNGKGTHPNMSKWRIATEENSSLSLIFPSWHSPL